MNFKTTFKILMFSATATLMACKGQFSSQIYNDASNAVGSQSLKYNSLGFKAFQSGLYAFTHESAHRCAQCHDTFVSPNFASSNIDHAYEDAKTRLDISNPLNSKFIEYSGNGHCGDTPCQNPANKDQVKALIQAWADAENADGGGGGQSSQATILFKTAALQVPATVPTMMAATPGVLRFSLSSLSPTVSGLENAILEVEITLMSPVIYKLNKPRIIGATRAVAFTGLHVYIKTNPDPAVNGSEDITYAPNWHNVNSTAAVFAKPNPLPAGPITGATPLVTPMGAIFIKKIGDGTTTFDNFVVGFEDIN